MSKIQKNKIQKNWLEWSVFALGLVLVAGTLGYLFYDAARMSRRPPTIEVRLGAPEQTPHNFIVPVHVTNHGDSTAEGVQIEVTLEAAEGEEAKEEERGEFAVAFLPRRAERSGWVAFRKDPRTGRLTARVLGYEKP